MKVLTRCVFKPDWWWEFLATRGTNKNSEGALRVDFGVVSFFERINYHAVSRALYTEKIKSITNLKCLHLNVFIDMIEVLRNDNIYDIEIG